MNENWTPKNPPPELSDTDAELLSAYIDNMLNAEERSALEARLASDAFLRSELAAMRQMLGWLKTMPTLKAPRNFTITEADVKPAAPKVIALPRRNNSWQIASAAAVFVLILGGVLLFNQLDFTTKEPAANQVAAFSTETANAESRDFFAETPLAPMLATVGPPQENPYSTGLAEGEAQDDSAETGRSVPTELGGDTAINSAGNNAQEPAPQGGSGSSGTTSGGSGDTDDGETSTAFGGGVADGQLGDTQVMTTSTSVAQLVVMATSTAQPSETALARATASPQPTMNAQVESTGFEPTAAAYTAESNLFVTASPEAASIMAAPTMEVVTGEVVAASTEELAQEESMMTMSIEAETTEATVEIDAAEGTVAGSDNNTQMTALATEPQDISSRINEILRRILLDILEN